MTVVYEGGHNLSSIRVIIFYIICNCNCKVIARYLFQDISNTVCFDVYNGR